MTELVIILLAAWFLFGLLLWKMSGGTRGQ